MSIVCGFFAFISVTERVREVMKEMYYQQVSLPAGQVHVYAGPELFAALDYKVFQMANNNLQIPNQFYMSYTPDVHVGVGTCIGTTAVWQTENGYVSPSIVGSDIGCGMRVHLTNMHKDELRDIKLRRKLVKAIDKYLPSEEHARGHFSDIRLEHVLKKGLHGLPKKYVPDAYTPRKASSLTHVESSKFSFDEEALNRFPEVVWHRSHRQLGTLGGGNHFAEIQAIEIAEENREIAQSWGLFDGQVAVMIHSGSRAWGGSVSQYCSNDIAKMMRAEGIGTADPKLVYAPLSHPLGEMYVNLLYSSLNYAVVNRHLIAYAIREAGKEVFGSKFEMSTLYDLMHNYARSSMTEEIISFIAKERHERCRQGIRTIRNPMRLRAIRHSFQVRWERPHILWLAVRAAKTIFIPSATEQDAFGRAARRSGSSLWMSSHPPCVSARKMRLSSTSARWSLSSMSPLKLTRHVDQIIESVVGAGLASVVAKCKPLATVKGV